MSSCNRYLLAVDGSDNSRRAAQYLIKMARGGNSLNITVVHVVNSRKEVYKFSPFTDIQDIESRVWQQGRELLEEQAQLLEREGIKVSKVVLDGDAGQEIARFAAEKGFEHIVLGSRGLSDFQGMVLGSVSHKVLHFASCPVILVK